jgi:hypothetical protein
MSYEEQLRVTKELQRMYDATTRLLSVAPTGRVDLGASQDYHDALVALTTLRDELRRGRFIQHNEGYWKNGATDEPVSQPPDPLVTP